MKTHELREYFEAIRCLTMYSERYAKGLKADCDGEVTVKRTVHKKVQNANKVLMDLINNTFGSEEQ